MRARAAGVLLVVASFALSPAACGGGSPGGRVPPPRSAPRPSPTAARPPAPLAWDALGILRASGGALDKDEDPMRLHEESAEGLRALAYVLDPKLAAKVGLRPGLLSQGNKAIAHHTVSRKRCLEGLKGVVIQTPEQRARCGGEANMVPVFTHGDPGLASFCVDVFEFPNEACELPMVWVNPADAESFCASRGKRLCDQEEWNLACRGDPAGGKDRLYAYGDELDLQICNTDKSRASPSYAPRCTHGSMDSLWRTCATDTEPSGSFPRCRSRFGVFDQHGNVAEIMTRNEWGAVKTQLKGSAFFYVDVAKKPWEKGGYYEKYPDHCNFYPLWHVETLATSTHVNYHLGFRCCKSVEATRKNL